MSAFIDWIVQGSLLAAAVAAIVAAVALAVSADSLRIVSVLDAVVLVASQGVTHREALADAAAGVRQAGGTVQGVVLVRESRWRAFPQLQWKRA